MTDVPDLEAMLARDAIRELPLRYAKAIETRDVDAMAELFAADARFGDYGTGPDACRRLMADTMELESSTEYRDAVEVLKKTEQDVIPRIENPEDRRELEELCRQVRTAMGSGDRQKMEEAANTLNDRLLNFAYLL